MKKITFVVVLVAVSFFGLPFFKSRAAEGDTVQAVEYATMRWDGRDNSYVVRPNAKVESLKTLFERYPRPERVDERIYFTTIAMNALSQEGFEFAGALNETVVMKRSLK
jgi:hypothetical protein